MSTPRQELIALIHARLVRAGIEDADRVVTVIDRTLWTVEDEWRDIDITGLGDADMSILWQRTIVARIPREGVQVTRPRLQLAPADRPEPNRSVTE